MSAAFEGTLLSIETSGDVCSVAVTRAGQFLAEHAFRHGMHLSERLLDHVEAALREADAVLEDVSAFVAGIGPGSFTGTRIGVMTVKTLAMVSGKPCAGVCGLEGLAAEYAGLRDTLIAPMLPCRSGVIYTALYRVEEALPREILPPDALPLETLADAIAASGAGNALLCGSAVARYREPLAALLTGRKVVFGFGGKEHPRASALANLAAARIASGAIPDDPLSLLPLYISPPPITLPKTPIPTGQPSGSREAAQ